MGTEKPGRPSFPARPSTTPFATAPPTMTPFSSSGPMVGPEASALRPARPSLPPSTLPSMTAGSAGLVEAPGFRPAPPSRFNDPSLPAPPPSYVPPAAGTFNRYPTPPFASMSPGPTHSPVIRQPPFQTPTSQASPPISFRPQGQVPVVPMGSSPVGGNPPRVSPDLPFPASRPNFQPSFPPSVSGYPTAGAPSQPPFPGYVKQANAVPQGPPVHSPFQATQGGYVPSAPTPSPHFLSQQGSLVQAPPLASPFGLHSRDQMQHSGTMPPMGGMQALVEDFSSLSIGSIPGSIEPGVDSKAFPRPLEGDVEPNVLPELTSLNCNARYLRLTTNAIPNSQSLASRWHLPLGAVVCPLAEAPEGAEVPVLNFVPSGIIRCRRCRTYVNPFVTFTDIGRKWRCNICSLLNDVPEEYYAQLDATGRRIDLDQRPELTNGSVEFVAPTEYMVRPPMPPLYFFLIDVSISAIKSGMIEVVAKTVKSCLDDLPGYPRTQIGFITYDSTVHFYNMKSSLTQPQMMVVSDLDDIFVPLPDDLLVNLSESRTVVEAFLDSLPTMFQDNMNVESAFGPALKAAFMVMSQLGGKLLIFQNTMPSLGVGRLKLRGDDPRVYGTDKEHGLRVPEDPFYKQMAADLTKYQIGVNIYACSDKYNDLASIGTLAKYTGGQVYYYPNFQAANHAEKLSHELGRDLTRETAWEAVMRIRCGKGIRQKSISLLDILLPKLLHFYTKMATVEVVSAQTAFHEEKPAEIAAAVKVQEQEEPPAEVAADSTPPPPSSPAPVASEEPEKEEEKKEITTADKEEAADVVPEQVEEVVVETTKEVVVAEETEPEEEEEEEEEVEKKPVDFEEETMVEEPAVISVEEASAVEPVTVDEPAAGPGEGAPEEKKVVPVVKTE